MPASSSARRPDADPLQSFPPGVSCLPGRIMWNYISGFLKINNQNRFAPDI